MRARSAVHHVTVAVLLAAAVASEAAAASSVVETLATLSPHRHIYAAELRGEEGIAVGALGTILETRDGGLTWVDRSLKQPLGLLAVALGGSGAVAVGQAGLLALRDGGRWLELQAPTEERLLGVAMNVRGFAVAVGAFGTVLRSEDGGRNWEAMRIEWERFFQLGDEPHVYDVHVDDRDRITLVGEFGMVLRSDDGGRAWRLLHSGDASLFALNVRGSTAFAVGQDGTVLRSVDSGMSWSRLDTGVQANLFGIAANPAGNELLVAGMRSVLYSSDGGNAWWELRDSDFHRGWYGDVAWSERAAGFLLVGHGGQIKSIKDIEQRGAPGEARHELQVRRNR